MQGQQSVLGFVAGDCVFLGLTLGAIAYAAHASLHPDDQRMVRDAARAVVDVVGEDTFMEDVVRICRNYNAVTVFNIGTLLSGLRQAHNFVARSGQGFSWPDERVGHNKGALGKYTYPPRTHNGELLRRDSMPPPDSRPRRDDGGSSNDGSSRARSAGVRRGRPAPSDSSGGSSSERTSHRPRQQQHF